MAGHKRRQSPQYENRTASAALLCRSFKCQRLVAATLTRTYMEIVFSLSGYSISVPRFLIPLGFSCCPTVLGYSTPRPRYARLFPHYLKPKARLKGRVQAAAAAGTKCADSIV